MPIGTCPGQLINARLAIREVSPLPIFLKRLFNPSLFARDSGMGLEAHLAVGPPDGEQLTADRQRQQTAARFCRQVDRDGLGLRGQRWNAALVAPCAEVFAAQPLLSGSQ